ncbi:MAG: quinone-dependent dihydroorotate dehydrogenase [Halobacteriaceae archaeon]
MDPYRAARPLLFALPAETAHNAVHAGMRAAQDTPLQTLLAGRYRVDEPRLETRVLGETFPNPVGVAAGFDKNARVPRFLASLGFGHVEVGGITAEAQSGNPRPRMFRLVEDEAIVNRMGFNNEGADTVGDRLAREDRASVPVGVNLGKSKSTPLEEAPDDYRYTYERVGDHVDYGVVNVSSPNTPGLRELQDPAHLGAIFDALREAGADPLLVKLSPDLHRDAVADAVALAEDEGLDGVIATNTTTDRPEDLQSPAAAESGGLSGKPLEEEATDYVRFVADRTDLPVVGVGGVFTAADAYEKIRAGASLVQLYTGLVYRGPAIAARINRGLATLLERDGFDSVEDAVGADM